MSECDLYEAERCCLILKMFHRMLRKYTSMLQGIYKADVPHKLSSCASILSCFRSHNTVPQTSGILFVVHFTCGGLSCAPDVSHAAGYSGSQLFAVEVPRTWLGPNESSHTGLVMLDAEMKCTGLVRWAVNILYVQGRLP